MTDQDPTAAAFEAWLTRYLSQLPHLDAEQHAKLVADIMRHYTARATADAGRIAELEGALDEIAGALDKIDDANQTCPVQNSSRSFDRCPRCFATDDQNCGPNIKALDELEATVRAALAAALSPAPTDGDKP